MTNEKIIIYVWETKDEEDDCKDNRNNPLNIREYVNQNRKRD